MKRALLLLACLAASLPFAARSDPGQSVSICGQQVNVTVVPVSSGSARIKKAGAQNLWLKGDGGLRRLTPDGNGIELADCQRILVTDLSVTGAFKGVLAANCEWLEFRNVKSFSNAQQGWLFINAHHVKMVGCEGSKTRVQHGCYFSNFARGYTEDIQLENCWFFGSRFSELQFLVEDGSRPVVGARLTGCHIKNDRFGLNLASVKDAQIKDTEIAASKAISVGKSSPSPWPTSGKVTGGKITGNLLCWDTSDLKFEGVDFHGQRKRGN